MGQFSSIEAEWGMTPDLGKALVHPQFPDEGLVKLGSDAVALIQSEGTTWERIGHAGANDSTYTIPCQSAVQPTFINTFGPVIGFLEELSKLAFHGAIQALPNAYNFHWVRCFDSSHGNLVTIFIIHL